MPWFYFKWQKNPHIKEPRGILLVYINHVLKQGPRRKDSLTYLMDSHCKHLLFWHTFCTPFGYSAISILNENEQAQLTSYWQENNFTIMRKFTEKRRQICYHLLAHTICTMSLSFISTPSTSNLTVLLLSLINKKIFKNTFMPLRVSYHPSY